MKPFKIVITGASRPELWYANKIGQEFECLGVGYDNEEKASVFFARVSEKLPITKDVFWDDCELAAQPAERNAAELKSMVLERFGSMLENQMAFGVVVFNGVHVPTLKLIFDEFVSATARANQADELRVELESAQSELAQLRRVAEAAINIVGEVALELPPNTNELVDELKAWKAWKAGRC